MSADQAMLDVALEADARLLLRQDEYLRDLTREFQLVRGGQTPTESKELLEAVDRLLQGYVDQRRAIRAQAELALRQGHAVAQIHLALPAATAEAAMTYMQLMRKAWALAEQGALLTLPPPADLRAFQLQWAEHVLAAMQGAQAQKGSAAQSAPAHASRPQLVEGERLVADFERPDATCARTARHRVRDLLAEWGAADVADSAVLTVSELVTNALFHGQPPLIVAATHEAAAVRIAVIDASPHLPERRSVDVDLATGRGLALIAALADDWGFETRADGKAVWARFSVTAPTQPADFGPSSSTLQLGLSSPPSDGQSDDLSFARRGWHAGRTGRTEQGISRAAHRCVAHRRLRRPGSRRWRRMSVRR